MRLIALLLLLPSVALAGNLAPGTYIVKPCPVTTPADCEPFMPPKCVELTAETCAPFCPVVEQPISPAATVLPQPAPLCIPVCSDVTPVAADAPSLVAPAPTKAHLKQWQRVAINFGIGVLAGAIIQHQTDDDDGDTYKKAIVYPPSDPPSNECGAHGNGHGTDCHH
jgi:hypothetical protein